MKRIFLLTIFAGLFLCSQFLLNCSSPLDSTGGFNPNPPGPGTTETLYIHDTVFVGDSVYDTVYLGDSICDTAFDTLFVTDTVYDSAFDTLLLFDTITDTFIDTFVVVDSFFTIDTVFDTIIDTFNIPCPDTCESEPICADFNQHNKKIYWNLHNSSGLHHLEFTGNFVDGCFDQILHIHVKGKKYEWDPRVNPVFTLDEDLRKDAKIMIHCKKSKDSNSGDSQSWGDDDNDCDDDDDDDDHGNKGCCNVEVCLKVTKL